MRPIDAVAAVAALRIYEDWRCPATSSAIGAIQEAISIIVHEVPTLDLDDLRPKGRWKKIKGTSSGWKQHRCSLCKAEAIFEYTYIDDYDEGIDGEWEYIGQRENGIIEHLTDFCPNCGADMRGGGEDA